MRWNLLAAIGGTLYFGACCVGFFCLPWPVKGKVVNTTTEVYVVYGEYNCTIVPPPSSPTYTIYIRLIQPSVCLHPTADTNYDLSFNVGLFLIIVSGLGSLMLTLRLWKEIIWPPST